MAQCPGRQAGAGSSLAPTQAAQGEENPAQEQAHRKSPHHRGPADLMESERRRNIAHPRRASGIASGISRARRSWAVAKRTNSKGTQAIIKLAASRKWPGRRTRVGRRPDDCVLRFGFRKTGLGTRSHLDSTISPSKPLTLP